MQPEHSFGDKYPWEELINSVDWKLYSVIDPKRANPLHRDQPHYKVWKEICNTWSYTAGFAQIAKQEQYLWPQALPEIHCDSLLSITKLFGLKDRKKMRRYWIALRDAKPGHCLFLNNALITDWRAGDVYSWGFAEPHVGWNFNLEPRYTLLLAVSTETEEE